jgi:hypothetical protein
MRDARSKSGLAAVRRRCRRFRATRLVCHAPAAAAAAPPHTSAPRAHAAGCFAGAPPVTRQCHVISTRGAAMGDAATPSRFPTLLHGVLHHARCGAGCREGDLRQARGGARRCPAPRCARCGRQGAEGACRWARHQTTQLAAGAGRRARRSAPATAAWSAAARPDAPSAGGERRHGPALHASLRVGLLGIGERRAPTHGARAAAAAGAPSGRLACCRVAWLLDPFAPSRPAHALTLPPCAPLALGNAQDVESAVTEAKDACKDGSAAECAAAWDVVEEISAAKGHAKDKAAVRGVRPAQSPSFSPCACCGQKTACCGWAPHAGRACRAAARRPRRSNYSRQRRVRAACAAPGCHGADGMHRAARVPTLCGAVLCVRVCVCRAPPLTRWRPSARPPPTPTSAACTRIKRRPPPAAASCRRRSISGAAAARASLSGGDAHQPGWTRQPLVFLMPTRADFLFHLTTHALHGGPAWRHARRLRFDRRARASPRMPVALFLRCVRAHVPSFRCRLARLSSCLHTLACAPAARFQFSGARPPPRAAAAAGPGWTPPTPQPRAHRRSPRRR